jgi:hypothetical protein
LEDHEWEVVDKLAGDDFICGLLDRSAKLGIETVGDVDFRSRLFQDTEGLDKRDWETLCRPADVKVLERAGDGMIRFIVPE